MGNEAIIHVVDDDLAVRQSLSFLLASDGLPVRLHQSASAFLDTVEDGLTGCILTDVRMPGIDGIEFLRRLKARGFTMPVIVMTGHADVPLAVEAMKQGAIDFIEKPFDDDLLLAAVRIGLDRHQRETQHQAQSAEIAGRLKALSEREKQVLDRLVAGKANKVIAFELDISPRTVEIYRANVMTKMRAGSLSELVRFALLVESGGDTTTRP
ncbi:two component transcriptional regulator, LuxR family [Bosea sp. OK403]|jgi:two-component system response regulator FixJ|uniref:response regulator FixJ n=1 Tax=Bosea sp. OK403 TaxID=1855286 RepID=UPI0008E7CC6B|nr:response regulator FixJ [Bosea sp. OK403]SFI13136.1 two component transcriptional regulator, LuxR family [Bosea sp. OK403]